MNLGLSFLKTRRDWAVIIVLCLICAVTSMVYSLQAPIYPREAENKGATSTEYGLVLGSYEIVVLIVSPIASNLILCVGPWPVFAGSATLSAATVVLFGFLGYIGERVLFVGLSFALRILQAIGASAVIMCVYSFISEEFTEGSAEAIGIIEIAFGAGLSVGPVFGSLLYSVGEENGPLAFLLPFIVIGSLQFVSGVVTLLVLRTGRKEKSAEEAKKDALDGKKLSFLQLIKMPPMLYFQFMVCMGCFNFGFQNALLSPYLLEAGLSTTWISGVFLLFGIVYTFACPGVAKYSNSMKQPIWLLLGGSICYVIAFALFSVSAMNIWRIPLTCLAVGMTGLGLGNTIMTGFVLCLKEAARTGYDDDKSVNAQVSALWMSAISLGGFLGPSAAGFLFEQMDFFWTSVIFLAANMVTTLTIPVFQLVRNQKVSRLKQNMASQAVPTPTKY